MAVKKSIAIIGEGETEWWYFETLRVACRYKFKVAPDFPQHSDIPHMAKLAEDYVKRETDYVEKRHCPSGSEAAANHQDFRKAQHYD